MKKFNLVQINFDYLGELKDIAKENPSLTMNDALELLAKKHPDAINEVGTVHEDGKFTKTEVTMEGVETKELNFEEEIEKLVKDSQDLDK